MQSDLLELLMKYALMVKTTLKYFFLSHRMLIIQFNIQEVFNINKKLQSNIKVFDIFQVPFIWKLYKYCCQFLGGMRKDLFISIISIRKKEKDLIAKTNKMGKGFIY